MATSGRRPRHPAAVGDQPVTSTAAVRRHLEDQRRPTRVRRRRRRLARRGPPSTRWSRGGRDAGHVLRSGRSSSSARRPRRRRRGSSPGARASSTRGSVVERAGQAHDGPPAAGRRHRDRRHDGSSRRWPRPGGRRGRESPRASASPGSPRAAAPPAEALATVSRFVASHASTSARRAAAREPSARRPPRPAPRRSGRPPCASVITSWRSRGATTRPYRTGRFGGLPDGGSLAAGERDAAGEHQALQEGVRGQPVGAVHAGAGHLAAGVEAGDGRAALEVGADAAGRVVAGRGDRDQLGDRVDAVLRRSPGWSGSAAPTDSSPRRGRRATCAGPPVSTSGA